MAEYLSPAVFVEELSSGIKPIQAVSTSIAAFVGHAERGPVGKAEPIGNFSQFVRVFGGFTDQGSLAFAVKAFFDEGGASCYVVRAAHFSGAPAVSQAVPARRTLNATARSVVRNGVATNKISTAAGFSSIQVSGGPANAFFLITYVAGSRTLTMTRNDGTVANAVLTPAAIAAGQTETASFPGVNGTIVLDSQFNKATSIARDPNVATVTGGVGQIDATTVAITAISGDISTINNTQLTLGSLNTPAAITVTAAGAFTGSFDGTATGVKPVVLTNGPNSISIQFNVTAVFNGAETAGTIDLQDLRNVVISAPSPGLRIEASSPGAWGNDLSIELITQPPDLFTIRVMNRGALTETIPNLSMDPLAARYVVSTVALESVNIAAFDLVPVASTLTPLERRPEATTAPQALTGGDDGLASIGTTDYIGDAAVGNGLHAFDAIDDVNIIAIPEAVPREVQVQGMAYCDARRDCFYIADAPETAVTADEVLNYKLARGLFAGGNALNSKFGALYAPWIRVVDPRTGGRITIPPSGAVAGRYARTDTARGVHKAAAGVTDGRLATAVDLAAQFTTTDQEKLNPRGINVIRRLAGTGNVIWGARTVSTDPEWRLVNVRRLFLFLEESIEESTTWVVFEPNDPALWKSIARNISAFLRLQWLGGALVGATEEQAFFVKCDAETNPPESVLLGRVITEIGVAPSKPAEFVIFRIQQFQAGSDVSE